MSETKFTPGPWEIGNGGSVITQTPDEQVDMSDYQAPYLSEYDVQDTIDFYGGHVICETVTPANAALIAAAPDLFWALVESLEAWDGYEFTAALDINLRKKMCAAIAKATGETQQIKKET